MKLLNHKGFSLIEILLVITLISLLFGIVAFTLNPSNILAEIEDNKKEADALTLYQALEQYTLKNGSYPANIPDIANGSSAHICKSTAVNCNGKVDLDSVLVPTYLSKIPEYSDDTNNSGFYIAKDSNGRIGIGGIKQQDNTTFVKGLALQSFNTNPAALPYSATIVTNGLVLSLDAGNPASYPGSGTTWTDVSGNNNNGTLINGVSYDSANGGSLIFDGINDYASINATNNFVFGSAPGTLSAWVNTNTLVGGWRFLLSYGQPAVGASRFIGINGSSFYSGGYGADIAAPGVQVNTWVNIVGIYDGVNATLYINGLLVSGPSARSWNTIPQNAQVGRQTNGGEYWSGNISNVSIYNRALTPEEVQQNFNALRGRYGL